MSALGRRQSELKRQFSQWDGSHQVEAEEFFENIRDEEVEESPETVRHVVPRPNNINNANHVVYVARPQPVNTGERYMREHYNDGVPVPQVLDKSCCGIIKRHKFRFALLLAGIALLIGFIICGVLYFVL